MLPQLLCFGVESVQSLDTALAAAAAVFFIPGEMGTWELIPGGNENLGIHSWGNENLGIHS